MVSDQKSTGAVELEKLDSQSRVAIRMPSVTADYLRSNYPHLNLQGVPVERQALQLLLSQQAALQHAGVIDGSNVHHQWQRGAGTWASPSLAVAVTVRGMSPLKFVGGVSLSVARFQPVMSTDVEPSAALKVWLPSVSVAPAGKPLSVSVRVSEPSTSLVWPGWWTAESRYLQGLS